MTANRIPDRVPAKHAKCDVERRSRADGQRPIEKADLLAFDGDEMFNYARDLQLDLESIRLVLHEALTALSLANDVNGKRQRGRILDLLGELRAAREEVVHLKMQLRVIQAD